jgi:hypothetical protein
MLDLGFEVAAIPMCWIVHPVREVDLMLPGELLRSNSGVAESRYLAKAPGKF